MFRWSLSSSCTPQSWWSAWWGRWRWRGRWSRASEQCWREPRSPVENQNKKMKVNFVLFLTVISATLMSISKSWALKMSPLPPLDLAPCLSFFFRCKNIIGHLDRYNFHEKYFYRELCLFSVFHGLHLQFFCLFLLIFQLEQLLTRHFLIIKRILTWDYQAKHWQS